MSWLALEEKTNNLTMALGGGRAASRVVGNGNRMAAEAAELANVARGTSEVRPTVAAVQAATPGVKAGSSALRAKGSQGGEDGAGAGAAEGNGKILRSGI